MILVLLLLACVAWTPAERTCVAADRACRQMCALHGDEGRHVHVGRHEVRCECETVGGLGWRP